MATLARLKRAAAQNHAIAQIRLQALEYAPDKPRSSKTFNTIDKIFTLGAFCGMVNTLVMKWTHIKRMMRTSSVRVGRCYLA